MPQGVKKFSIPQSLGDVEQSYDYFWQPPSWVVADPQERIIEGYASMPNLDDQNDVIPIEVIEEAVPDFMKWGTLREMHGSVAAGKVLAARVDGAGLWIRARIDDPNVWAKVQSGVYQGFSIGGSIPDGAAETLPDGTRVIRQIRLAEISVVDRPANPQCRIQVVKFARPDAAEPQKNTGTADELLIFNNAGLDAAATTPAATPPPQPTSNFEMDLAQLKKFRGTLVDPDQIQAFDQSLAVIEKAVGAGSAGSKGGPSAVPASYKDGNSDVSSAEEDEASAGVDNETDEIDRIEFTEGKNGEDGTATKAMDGDEDAEKAAKSKKAPPQDDEDPADEDDDEDGADGADKKAKAKKSLSGSLEKALIACRKAIKVSGDENASELLVVIKGHLNDAVELSKEEPVKEVIKAAAVPANLSKLIARISELEDNVQFLAQRAGNFENYANKFFAAMPQARRAGAVQNSTTANGRDDESDLDERSFSEVRQARRASAR